MNPDLDDIRKYQRYSWGQANGETCVIELSGLASPNMRLEQDRATFLLRRIERIRGVLDDLKAANQSPEFIVMYGQGNRAEWEQIAGSSFDSTGPCMMGKTVAAIAPHPVTREVGNEYWVNLGRCCGAA